MKTDWTDIVKEEVLGTPSALPEGDWDRFQQKYKASRRRAAAVRSAVAGGLALLAGAGIFLFTGRDAGPAAVALDNAVAEQVEETAPAHVAPAVQEESPILTMSGQSDRTSGGEEQKIQRTESLSGTVVDTIFDEIADMMSAPADATPADSEPSLTAEVQTESAGEPAQAAAYVSDARPIIPDMTQLSFEDLALLDEPSEPVRNLPLSFGLAASSSTGSGLPSSLGKTSSYMDAVPVNAPTMMYANTSPAESRSVSESQQVSVGTSARCFLSRHFAVQAGLNYSRSTRSAQFNYVGVAKATMQEDLHFLSVPVTLDWVSSDQNVLCVYLGGGVQADKCIQAKGGSRRSSDLPVQFALTSHFGVQCNLSRHIGIYAEPQLSYYLTDNNMGVGSSASGPWFFTALAGLRFSL